MYPKLQSKGIAGGDNSGSCASYAYYLEHENRWKKKNGQKDIIIPFFDKNRKIVPMSTVIKTIDANKAGLHAEDAKFFSLVINPSEKEIEMLGVTREEKLESLHRMVNSMMDRYATGFNKDEMCIRDSHHRQEPLRRFLGTCF